MMAGILETHNLTKRFDGTTALEDLTISIPAGSVVGLIGPNGSGKTTLLHHATGLYLPSSGSCSTFGVPADRLGPAELSRLGVVQQEGRFVEWMTVRQQLRYVASFYDRWDRDLEQRLLRDLEIDPAKRVAALSSGNAQKLSIVLALCHRPELLLLDEPVSALDPLARETLFRFLLDLLADEKMTIVISSHVLRDIERLVNRVVCLEIGRLRVDARLDELQERYSEWRVTCDGNLPREFPERFVLQQEMNRSHARLVVRDAAEELERFRARHGVEVTTHPLNLEAMYPFLLGERNR